MRQRAGNRCEYCRIHQRFYRTTFHVEHVVAKQHGGADDLSNLALSCHFCNWQKGPNLSGIDPQTQSLTRLFHPRNDLWEDHFGQREAVIRAKTTIGRTTVAVLAMNAPERVQLRTLLEPEYFQ